MGVARLALLEDAEELTALLVSNREFLAPWDPARAEEFFTVAVGSLSMGLRGGHFSRRVSGTG